MPYIEQNDRDELLDGKRTAETPGELNFVFSIASEAYLRKRGLSYQTVNDIVGALEGAKLELYARIARPYEDRRILANGDVYSEEFTEKP